MRALGLPARGVRLVSTTDDPVETHVVVDADPSDEGAEGGQRAMHFQEWWVRHHAALPARRILAVGAEQATPWARCPGRPARRQCRAAFSSSNPVVSIGPVLAVPGVRDALRDRAPVVGLSPIVGGAPVRGMADACLRAIGVATTARAVGGRRYADLLDAWLVDTSDAELDGSTEPSGRARVHAVPLMMTDVDATAEMARTALDLALTLTGGRSAGRSACSRPARLRVVAVPGIGAVSAGDDLGAMVAEALAATGTVLDDDVVVVASKVVARPEGRTVPAADRERALDAASVSEVAAGTLPDGRRTRVVRTGVGPVLAAAGIDASDVPEGVVLLLPADPDASARALRARLHELTGARPAVLVTDTSSRPWRDGVSDFALGAAGLVVVLDDVLRARGPRRAHPRGHCPRAWPTRPPRPPTWSRARPPGRPSPSSAGWGRTSPPTTGRVPPSWSAVPVATGSGTGTSRRCGSRSGTGPTSRRRSTGSEDLDHRVARAVRIALEVLPKVSAEVSVSGRGVLLRGEAFDLGRAVGAAPSRGLGGGPGLDGGYGATCGAGSSTTSVSVELTN